MTQKDIKEVFRRLIKDYEKEAEQNLKDNEPAFYSFNRGYICALTTACDYLSEDEE